MACDELTTYEQLERSGYTVAEIGRAFVEAGGAKLSQTAQRAEWEYYEQQRDQVAAGRKCDGGCVAAELIETPDGRVICRRTRRPCVRLQAAAELELWRTINNGDRSE